MNKNLTKQQIDLYFPKPLLKNGLPIQVVSSGPDKKYNQIEECYYKIINQAKSFLYIQTPYFVVEDSLLNAIISAKNRAVDVKIFIPNKPDKKLVYAGTILCLKKLIKNNVNVYLYNGFIHSKVIITESVLSVGTCNFDNRSFKLNFEDTCLIYNNKTIKIHKNKIEQEMQNSKYVTIKKYKKLSSHNILFKMFYKLLYKIL